MTKLFKIELKNRKGETIHTADNIAQDATVLALKKQFLKDCPKLSKSKHTIFTNTLFCREDGP